MEVLFAVNDPIDILDYLQSVGVTVTLDRPTGRLHVRPRPVPARERELIISNQALLHAVLVGPHTGHAWVRCDECGAGMMRKKSAGQRKCAVTPGCEGRMHRAHGPTDRGVISPGKSTGPKHPARFSKELLPVLARELERWQLPVHDPFAGTGERLGQLCDQHGLAFTGTEIEPEFILDRRVRPGDATEAASYPTGDYVVATSPTYPNDMSDHFHRQDGTKGNTYRYALGENLGYDRELDEHNTGSYGLRSGARALATYWKLVDDAVSHWPDRAVVNVKDFVHHKTETYTLTKKWVSHLEAHGYTINQTDVPCPGYKFGANRDRVETEAILVCERNREPKQEDPS
jgi:hypothetical protein